MWIQLLELKNIKKIYHSGEDVVALKGMSVKFENKGFVSILGPSGCGKTTLLNVIGGLDVYDSGDLIIKGKSTKSFKTSDWDAYRNNFIGFVFQNYNLISHQTILKNVEVALTLSGISKAERTRRARQALIDVGLKDQMNKKPTQLSGGQMQRVAIARALVNNPEVILADEPTGALDSHTSVQIMDILKEISNRKLVIMVTHNAELAQQYSSRIIKMLDGDIELDTNLEEIDVDLSGNNFSGFKKTSMSIFNAIGLSFGNLMTKKWRTILTSFAGSIGIIGIALVLAISNGSKILINEKVSDMLSDSPIQISKVVADGSNYVENTNPKYPDNSNIIVNDPDTRIASGSHQNIITPEYMDYINKMKGDLKDKILSVSDARNLNMNLLAKRGNKIVDIQKVYSHELPTKKEEFEKQYELVGSTSRMPVEKDEIVIIVDSQNQVSKYWMDSWNLKEDDVKNAESLVGKTLAKLVDNDNYYIKEGNTFRPINSEISKIYDDSSKSLALKVVGVVRPSRENEGKGKVSAAGIGYTNKLEEHIVKNSMNSQIVLAQKNSDLNVTTGQKFSNEAEKKSMIADLGGSDIPEELTIIPADVEGAKQIKEYLDKYNEGKADEDKIIYVDFAKSIIKTLETAVNMASVVLIALASISLVVSSIMIAILTYVSVLERTKEIGILRSIGARKKDVSRLFNAENIIIGFIAGTVGVGLTYLLSSAVNVIAHGFIKEVDSLAVLNPIHALLLIVLSIGITLIAGFIPSKMAARKKPVDALRTE